MNTYVDPYWTRERLGESLDMWRRQAKELQAALKGAPSHIDLQVEEYDDIPQPWRDLVADSDQSERRIAELEAEFYRRGWDCAVPSSSSGESEDMNPKATPELEYYILDASVRYGDCALWWRPDGNGYTCNLEEAGLYAKAPGRRPTDVYVHRDVVARVAVRHVRIDDLHKEIDVPKVAR